MNQRNYITLALVALAVALSGTVFTGCETIQNNPAIAQGVVQIATYEAIERSSDPADTASNIIAIDETVQASVSEDGIVSLAAVATLVDAELADLNLMPARRAQAGLLVSVLAAQIESRIDTGQLDPEALTTVRQVSAWSSQAAHQYLLTQSPTPAALSLPE